VRRQLLFVGRITASVSLVAHAAIAQTTDRSAAVAIFDEAERLSAEGKYAEACPKYAESNRLDPQLGALLHLADCYEKAGKTASAWASWRDAADLAATRGDPREQIAREHSIALEPKLSRLTIVVSSDTTLPGLEVRRDGIVVGASLWGSAIPVDPGEHSIEAVAPSKQDWSNTVTVGGTSDSVTVTIPQLVDVPREAPPQQAAAREQPQPPRVDRDSQSSAAPILAWTALGVGAVGLTVGTVFWISAKNKVDEYGAICNQTGADGASDWCPENRRAEVNSILDDARTAKAVAIVGYALGIVGVGTGVTLMLTSRKRSDETGSAPFSVQVGAGFVAARARF
jgi:hypothetical protein